MDTANPACQVLGINNFLDFLNENSANEYFFSPICWRAAWRAPFIEWLKGRYPAYIGRAKLVREEEREDIIRVLGIEEFSERRIADLRWEIGDLRQEGDRYEQINLRFREEVELKSGLIIPKSRIVISVEIPEMFGEISVSRIDERMLTRKLGNRLFFNREYSAV
ncbi:hypothetical protein HYW76_02975 [Candidatus Pacearchaeota archaeon]|nr:hypothetical protein [Candidatus Pacearchaeota archaeon]